MIRPLTGEIILLLILTGDCWLVPGWGEPPAAAKAAASCAGVIADLGVPA